MQLFGSSGIRAIADVRLLELAFRVGLAVGGHYSPVVIGGDTRTSTEAVKHAVISGLLLAGAKTLDGGMMPTPVLAYAAREFAAAVMITASHNPPQYNGIKLFNPDGSAFDAAQRRLIEEMVLGQRLGGALWQKMEGCQRYEGAASAYQRRVLADFHRPLSARVVVDCGGGAASPLTPHLLAELGCEVTTLNCQTTGHFPRPSEPTEGNIQELAKLVIASGADLGIAHDGDGDRVVVVDDRGEVVAGDRLLAILARSLGAEKVVTTVDASLAIEGLGFEVTRTRVGDAFVSETLRALVGEGARALGGEPSGAYIFPWLSLCPDGIYAAATIVEVASQVKLSTLVDELPSYPLLRGSIPGSRKLIEDMEPHLIGAKPVSVGREDGLKLNFEDGWLLIRASGTEPKIRITAEARTRQRAEELYDYAIRTLAIWSGGR